ncbi:hypothetical protein [Burkholderia gladioli]|uniref:hypothetical protein n=1 Tax=Burkholderia gladioli TaxID=28095 RepID=UPI0030163FEE
MDEPNQARSTDVTQAVADSNAAAVASLSTSISGTEANAGAVAASAQPVSLSTSISTSQEAGGATSGESAPSAVETASTPAKPDLAPSTPAITSSAPESLALAPLQASPTGSGSEEAGGAAAGESSGVPVADASTPANVTLNQDVSPSRISNGETLVSTDAPVVAPAGESLGAALSSSFQPGTESMSGSATGIPAPDSFSSATTTLSTAEAPDTSSTGAPLDPTTVALSSTAADATLADAGGIPPTVAPGAVPPETLLARLHADLEALERKIELGIHVFAHEVAAIRDQVKSLI